MFILCKCLDALMLLKFLRFFRVNFILPLTKNVCWYGNYLTLHAVMAMYLPLASLTRVLPQEPGRIEYYIYLCGHFGAVSELQTSLDVSDLFKGHEELTSCSAFMHSYMFPLQDVL